MRRRLAGPHRQPLRLPGLATTKAFSFPSLRVNNAKMLDAASPPTFRGTAVVQKILFLCWRHRLGYGPYKWPVPRGASDKVGVLRSPTRSREIFPLHVLHRLRIKG